MKMGFERGPLSIQTPEEELRKEGMDLRKQLELNRENLVADLALIEDIASDVGIDLDNEYDPRLKDESYAGLRQRLLAKRIAILGRLEEDEELLDTVLKALHENRTHDA